MFISNVRVLVQVQAVTIVSAPWSRKRKRGKRLVKNASLTAVLTFSTAQSGVCGVGERVVKTGYRRMRKTIKRHEDKRTGVTCIAATWSCTKSFWFLRPTDELLSFRS